MEAKIIKALAGLNQGSFKPKKPITSSVVVNILNDIANNAYHKDNYFLKEEYQLLKHSNKDKDVIFRLNAVTELSETISVNLGGIVYDEPYFAVAAALNLGKNKLAMPVAKNYETYKVLASKTELGLQKKNFKPDFFTKVERFFNPKTYEPANAVFDIVNLEFSSLTKLQNKGSASFLYDNEVKFFELYHNPDF